MSVWQALYSGLGFKSTAGDVKFASETDPFPVKSAVISTGNSSTSALGAAGVFTGDWEDVSAYDSLVVAVATDANGSYQVQFSPDGTNADSTLTRYYRTSQIEAPHRFTITRRYARVVYTNGSSAQTYFRLQTAYGDKAPLNAPMDGTLAQDFDATVVRPTDFDDEVALGRRQGVSTVIKFGFNDDVDSASEEVVAAFGGTFTPLSSAETMDVVSDDSNDDGSPAGTGAQTLLITGVDSTGSEATEIVTMNGTTTVTTSTSWFGLNRVVVLAAGSGQTNAGNITITATTAATNQAYLPAETSVTEQLIYTTPADQNALISGVQLNARKLSGGSAPRVTFKLNVWNRGVTNAVYELFRWRVDTAIENTVDLPFPEPLLLSPTDVMYLTADTDTNNTAVSGRIYMKQVRQADA